MSKPLKVALAISLGSILLGTTVAARIPSAPHEIESREEKQKPASGEPETEQVTPLTAEERALNARELVLSQPDFSADLRFFVSEGFGAFGGAQRVFRRGNRYRDESEFWIFVGEIGKPAVRLYPQSKSYDDFLGPRHESVTSMGANNNLQALAKESSAVFTALGTVTIDGHTCIKIEVVRDREPKRVYLYVARDLRNLVLVARVIGPKHALIQKLSNVSFDVPPSLVEVPPDYKPIERDRWIKMESAHVTCSGQPCKSSVVFRAPGGELFMRVDDGTYEWTYLVRPQGETVETAFQGLLVTRSGEYVWRTNETEAFSDIGYRTQREGQRHSKAVVTVRSVRFRSTNYERNQTMIEVSW